MSLADIQSLADHTLVQRSPDLFAADMDGDLVMMDMKRGDYFGLGGIAPRLWELLETPRTPATLRVLVMSEFDVDEATCRKDIGEFLAVMLEKGLIRAC